ncbi:MAG: (d)CMP kinase [Acidobacteria bacterium]|nr:(d)CMP kinase [Acidobacteriota bacterium]
MARRLIIAIDGPSGVGKGTVSRTVAETLGYRHVDTGIMYRAVGLKAARLGLAFEDEDALACVAGGLDLDIAGGRVRLDGEDVTQAIRTAEMDRAASAVARHARVRKALVSQQQALGADGGIVMEGRDIGTVVFPAADVKIYLDAAPEERARRRALDPAPAACGRQEVAAVASDLEARDRQDSSRAASPLSVAPDAVVIDTTTLSIPEVVARVLTLIRAKQPVP